MNRGYIKKRNYILGSTLLLIILLLNIFIIGRTLRISKTKLDVFQTMLISIGSLQDSITTVSSSQTILFKIKEKDSEYILNRRINETLREITISQARIRSLANSEWEVKRKFLEIEFSINRLKSRIEASREIKADLDDKEELELRSLTQLTKNQLSVFESELIYIIANISKSLFTGVVLALSVEIILFIIITILLYLSVKRRKAAEDSITRIKNYLDNIINYMPSVVMVVDSKCKVTLWNRTAKKESNLSTSDVVGRSIEEVYPAIIPQLPRIKSSITDKNISKIKGNRRTEEERDLYEDITIYPLIVNQERGAVIIIEDITDQVQLKKQFEESEEKFKALVENLGEEYVFYTLNRDGSYAYVSPSIEKMLGYTRDEFIINYKSYPTDSILNRIANRKKDYSIRGIKQKPYLFEVMDIHGEVHYIEITEKPIFKDGSVISVEGIAHDITERINGEKELNRYKNSLQDLVENRTKELRESIQRLTITQDKLIESEKMASLGSLVAGVAHEINTPIGIIVTAASHMEERLEEFDKLYNSGKLTRKMLDSYFSDTREISKLILSSSGRASGLIHSFKEIAVDQSGEKKRFFKVREYIDEILLSLHYQLKEKRIKFNISCTDDLTINSYPGAFSQILTNLILNSIKHGFTNTSKGFIVITIEKEGNRLFIQYEDNGHGIPENALKRIYEPFYTTKRGEGAKGLGMSIVYNLVKKTFKGNIKCISREDKGTTFRIDFDI